MFEHQSLQMFVSVIKNEMSVKTAKFANVWSQIITIMSNFHPLEVVELKL